MPDCIELRGIRVLGTHGVLPEERHRPQPFAVDVDLVADLRGPGRTDDLADTVDYGAVAEAVALEVAGPSSALLERLAERIAQRILEITGGRVSAVTVSVHKLRPPVPVEMTSAGVRVTRP